MAQWRHPTTPCVSFFSSPPFFSFFAFLFLSPLFFDIFDSSSFALFILYLFSRIFSLSLSLSLYPPFPNLFFESNQSLHVRLHDNVSHRDSTAGVDPPQNHLPMDHHRARFYLLASYFQFARCSEI